MKWLKIIDFEVTKKSTDYNGSNETKFTLEVNPFFIAGMLLLSLIYWLL